MLKLSYSEATNEEAIRRHHYRSGPSKDSQTVPDGQSTPENTPLKPWQVLLCFVLLSVFCCLIFLAVQLLSVHWVYAEHISDHGSNLTVFLENVRDEPYECWASFNRWGGKILEYSDYNENSIAVPDQVSGYAGFFGGKIMAHNHPQHDVPFSDADIKTFMIEFCQYGVEETVVSSPNYIYSLRVTAETPRDPRELAAILLEVLGQIDGPSSPYVQPIVLADGTTGLASTELLMEAVAEELHLEYTKTTH